MEWRVKCDEAVTGSGVPESRFGERRDRARVGQVASRVFTSGNPNSESLTVFSWGSMTAMRQSRRGIEPAEEVQGMTTTNNDGREGG